MVDVDDIDFSSLPKKRRTNVLTHRPVVPTFNYRHISPPRERAQLRSLTFSASLYDIDELERSQPKTLFLCVQLCNYDNVIMKISPRTTAKHVITRLRAYHQVKKLYPKSQDLQLVLSVCLALNINCASLPIYYELHRLHTMGFWTKPDQYTHSPLVTLIERDKTHTQERVFQLPEVLQCAKDPLVHGGKAPNWSSNSGESIAFRLKFPLKEGNEGKILGSFARFPEFFDESEDTLLLTKDRYQVNIHIPDYPLTETSLGITHQMTLRDSLRKLKQKLKLQDRDLPIDTMMLKLTGSCEYIWTLDLPLLHFDGIRDSIRTHKIPELQLLSRPIDLESGGKLPNFELYDLVVPLTRTVIEAVLDNLDVKCFPVNDLDLDDEDTLGMVIRSRTSVGHSDLPDYVQKRSSAFTRGTIFMSPVDTQTRKTTYRPQISPTTCFSSLTTSTPEPDLIDVRKLHKFFKVKILGIDGLKMYTYDQESMTPLLKLNPDRVRVEVTLYTGSVQLEPITHSTTVAGNAKDANGRFLNSVRWGEWVVFTVRYSQLPQASSLKFSVFAYVAKKESKTPSEKLLGWVNFRLFDYANRLETGVRRIGLYPYYSAQDKTGSTTINADPGASQLFIQLESFLQPVAFCSTPDSVFDVDAFISDLMAPVNPKDKQEILRLANEHPLYELAGWEKALLWRYRAFTSTLPNGLPKLLQSLDWCNPQCVRDIHSILQFCSLQTPLVGLELLDGKFADVKIRDYAVKCLESMSTYEFQQYLIQLVQALKFEPYHDSALARLLMKRALRNPSTIGHTMFWLLRSEMEELYFQERFGLLLEQFVRKCGPLHSALFFEDHLLHRLEHIAQTIQKSKQESKEDLTEFLRSQLRTVNEEMPEFYSLSLNPKVKVKRIKVEECKFMQSKKRPIYLVFENLESEDKDIHILFKYGDDLRQDMLVLQTMRVMNSLWTAEGLDLQLSLYRCLTLGSGEGMLEIVQGAKTLADIHKWRGGQRGVFSKKTLAIWLEANKTGENQVDNFVRSCAGYSVGMYVLGVGDRHSDNLMLKYSGHVFHIDFGHFLGYFKKKLGIKRETAPFVFTTDFRYAMGGKRSKGYDDFKHLCTEAYNVLRRNRRLLITLFCLMLCSGIPELTRKDIGFLLNTLPPGLTDEEAGKLFLKALKQALKSTMTKLNFAIHLLAH